MVLGNIYLDWLIIILLVIMSGLFSGLNLGLMGLDPMNLEIVMSGGSDRQREYASKIRPLRARGNWLLCTLLLGNVAVNAGLSILFADYAGGTVGFAISTAVIVVFGEIIPQALCSRYALFIGAKTIWIVYPLMILMSPIAWPIAWILDRVLGDDIGVIYSNKELQKLVDIHAKTAAAGLNKRTANMLKGTLGLTDSTVSSCMTHMIDVFWLNDSSKLSFDVLSEIFKSGHSRIPIFNTDCMHRIHCIGLLYVKDLILLDPDDEMPVTQIMNAFGHKTPPTIWKDDTIETALLTFIQHEQHLAFVQAVRFDATSGEDNTYEYVGIITLEDVIEYILKLEFVDEHDNFRDNKHLFKTKRLGNIDWDLLHMFNHQQRGVTKLPPQELQAIFHFLSQAIKVFAPKNGFCTEAGIKNLLATSSVLKVTLTQDAQFSSRMREDRTQFTQRDPYKDIENNGLLLYQRDQKTEYFTLLLDGKCEIYAGRQGFRSELHRWSYLCPDALDFVVEGHKYSKPLLDYVPDFTCKVIENSRILRVRLKDFLACLEGKFDFQSAHTPQLCVHWFLILVSFLFHALFHVSSFRM